MISLSARVSSLYVSLAAALIVAATGLAQLARVDNKAATVLATTTFVLGLVAAVQALLAVRRIRAELRVEAMRRRARSLMDEIAGLTAELGNAKARLSETEEGPYQRRRSGAGGR